MTTGGQRTGRWITAGASGRSGIGIAVLQRQPPERGRRRAARRSTSRTATTTASRSWTRATYEERDRIGLSPLRGLDRILRGVQPVGLALSPDARVPVCGGGGRQRDRRHQAQRHERTAAWATSRPAGGRAPCGSATTATRLYVANARGRGATPEPRRRRSSPKFTVIGTVNIIPIPSRRSAGGVHRSASTPTTASSRAVEPAVTTRNNPIPSQLGKAERSQIKHVIFINKENATHDLMLGDITATRARDAGERRAELLARLRCEPESSRTGAALRVQRQLLPRAVGVVGRPPLADRSVHGRVRGDALAGRRTAAGAGTPATIRRSSRTFPAGSASPTPTRRPSRTTTTSTAASTAT